MLGRRGVELMLLMVQEHAARAGEAFCQWPTALGSKGAEVGWELNQPGGDG